MIHVDQQSGIPLFGLDFIGILDRGTNLIEIKPITICNLRCKYCFVNAHFGCAETSSDTNIFQVEPDYMLKWLKVAIELKDCNDIEVHIAPYGEFFLYPHYLKLLKGIKKFYQVKTISIQTNGTQLTEKIITELELAGISRLNISLNAIDEKKARILSGTPEYNVSKIIDILPHILKSKIDLLIAPIWFFKFNDDDIIQIIKLAKHYMEKGYNNTSPILGIQNYLLYKTGRKFWKVEAHTFDYFYKRLSELEKQYNIKLKLGPRDFGIHPTKPINPPVEVGSKVPVKIICKGRSINEYIGVLNEMWAVKVISKYPLISQKTATVTIIKQKANENLITATFSGSL